MNLRRHVTAVFSLKRIRLRPVEDDPRPYFEAVFLFQAADDDEADKLWHAMEDVLGCPDDPLHICPHFRFSSVHKVEETDAMPP